MGSHRERTSTHDHDAMLDHLINEWGHLGTLKQLLATLPSDKALQLLELETGRMEVELPTSELAVWKCKIGEAHRLHLPKGRSDSAMREAVESAYRALTGYDADFTFSGWGGRLTEAERAVVEDRYPNSMMFLGMGGPTDA